jgi:uncharacterized membrane protein YkvI
VSTKSFALIGAALLLLDYASTSVVSAATAASYLAGEVTLPFPTFVGAIIILAIFTLISLSGIRESARLALIVLSLHVSVIDSYNACRLTTAAAIDNGRIDSMLHRSLEKRRHRPTDGKLAFGTGSFCKGCCSADFLRILSRDVGTHRVRMYGSMLHPLIGTI